jgi:hypothetical protein
MSEIDSIICKKIAVIRHRFKQPIYRKYHSEQRKESRCSGKILGSSESDVENYKFFLVCIISDAVLITSKGSPFTRTR